jgi:hypothetical protein
MIFNVIKHHFRETIDILHCYNQLNKSEKEIIKLLNKIGTNSFDVYTGNLSVKEILFCSNKNPVYTYESFEYFLCSDGSLWIIKNIYKKNQLIKHLHPARKNFILNLKDKILINPNLHIRVYSYTYKTILLLYWNLLLEYRFKNYYEFINIIHDIDIKDKINDVRTRINMPFIHEKHFNQKKYIDLFCKFFKQ